MSANTIIQNEKKLVYEFGSFRLDTFERQLFNEGQVISLPPKVFETLLALVENSGQIMEKRELLNLVWPDSFVEEGSLTQNIFHLRKALGDAGENNRFIETLPRRGYRFVAEVSFVWEPLSAQPQLAKLSATTAPYEAAPNVLFPKAFDARLSALPPAPTRRWLWPVAGVLLLALIALAILFRFFLSPSWAPALPMQVVKLTTHGKALHPAISPDGKYVAYAVVQEGEQSLWVRQVASVSNLQIVSPKPTFYRGTTFSPDSSHVYYLAYDNPPANRLMLGTIYKIPVLGGTPEKVIEDVDSPISFSPDGRRIAFIRFAPAAYKHHLVIADADGSNERTLLTRPQQNGFAANQVVWSPNGKALICAIKQQDSKGVFINLMEFDGETGTGKVIGKKEWNFIGGMGWTRQGNVLIVTGWDRASCVLADQIWQIPYPTGEARRITYDVNGYWGISTAREAAALVTIQAHRSSHLYVATDGDFQNAKRITSGFGDYFSDNLGLAWTPDNKIVYSTTAAGNPDIWMMGADGSDQKQLTTDERADLWPQVTADGRTIIFLSERKGPTHIWRMNLDGTETTQLTNSLGDFTPNLSPDGRWVVYFSEANGAAGLWKVSIDGGEPIRLSQQVLSNPVISPDGKTIACLYQQPETLEKRIALVDFETGEIIRFLDSHKLGVTPRRVSWTRDGKGLTFVATNKGVSNLWVLPIEGGEEKPLTDFQTGRIFRFAWSMDGKRMVFERGEDINDVVLITNFAD